MINKTVIILIISLFLITVIFADTNFRVMSYNSLNFDGTSRLSHFQTVFEQIEPDIVICQEIISEAGATAMLSVLNDANGGYAQAEFVLDTDLNNMLYYKTSLGTLVSQDEIDTSPRDISEYVMNIDGNLIRFYSCHLKASEDFETERLAAVTILRNHLNALPEGTEFIIVGDMNFYTSSETGYQKFIEDEVNNIGRSQDLCTAVGSWHNNSNYSAIHSQSTRVENFGYGATGGLDDKFDFIFGSYGINNGSGIEYSSNSFTSFGNDGAHFNLSVNDGTNSAVPDSVADALYYASDHLPVYADFASVVGGQPSGYVFISEYIEGSSYNKAIEIFNGTGASVDLSAYSLEKDVDGNEDWDYTYNYSGTLAHGDVFVLANSVAVQAILDVADDTDNWVINFNGNDQVRLLKYGVEIDRIGIPGDIDFAKDVTYVRKSTVTEPLSGPQDPRSNGEWDEYPVDTFSYLGSHSAINPTITVTSPNGDEEWDRGNSYDITWTSSDFTDNVKVELYKATVRGYTELISSTENDGLWQWDIPSEETIASDYKIRISDSNDGIPYDVSDSFFSITGTQTITELFISEYIEGSSYNKALEIYNGTGSIVDLSGYKVVLYSNGATTPYTTLNLSGTLLNGAVFVIAHGSAGANILAITDTTSGVANWNGNDHVSLQSSDGTPIDGIGVLGSYPVSGWDVAGVTDATKEHTLVRKSTITAGNTDWSSSAGTNATDSEWIVYDVDTFSYLGFHIAGPLSAPTNVTIVVSDTSVTISWNEVSGATSYHIYSSDYPQSGFELEQTVSFSDTSWTTSIPSGKKFYYVTAE